MKKFLENDEFEDYFDSDILSRGLSYYYENRILDIWYHENNIFAYIEGSEIYKVELEIKNGQIRNCFCSCPYSEDGEYTCKHITAVLYYLRNNEIPELEKTGLKKEKENRKDLDLNKIYNEMEYELEQITDKHGFINYFNGRYFVRLIFNISSKIERFIEEENYNDAFELIKHTYYFIKDTAMDGSNGEYQEALNELSEAASKLLDDEKYYQNFLKWANDVVDNNELNDFSDAPLYAFILYAHDKESALKVVKFLDNFPYLDGIFTRATLDKITLVHDYIDTNEAIDLCYQNINEYWAKEQLIEYLKEENRIDEVVKILKDDIKNNERKNLAYNKLIKVYDENNMFDEKKKILPEAIVETNSFGYYKEFKKMCNEAEWKILKEQIISEINPNNKGLLEDIYFEENEPDKLFALIEKDHRLDKLYQYQEILKNKYSKELLNFYKLQIIEEAKLVSNRAQYNYLCSYIKDMDELNDSSTFIFEMIREMYPLYRNKKAFKEEIMNVLNNENKEKFSELINNKMEVK